MCQQTNLPVHEFHWKRIPYLWDAQSGRILEHAYRTRLGPERLQEAHQRAARHAKTTTTEMGEKMNLSMVSKISVSLLLVGALAACGSSSSDVTPAPTATAVTLSGTATNGAPISGKTVEAKCASGTGSGSTSTDGNYSVSIDGGTWPCLARVTAADGTVLHTVAAGSGSTATANITPVTELVVASLAGASPATYYAGFDSTAAATVTSTTVAVAQTAVVATLKSGGVDLTAVGDVITATLTPAYTAALTSLASTFTSSGTTLAELTTTVAATSTTTATGTPVTSGTPSLPAAVALKAAASNCSALRSGTYRMVAPKSGTTLPDQTGLITINAETLAITYDDGSTDTLTASGSCEFSFSGPSSDMKVFVSQAGVIVVRYSDDAGLTHNVAIGFPAQTHTQAELAGNWNALGIGNTGATYTGFAASATIDTAGAMTAVKFCQNTTNWDVKVCSDIPDGVLSMKANADGGFDFVDAAEVTGRVFAYQAGGGELMLVDIDTNGGFTMYTKQRTSTLPTVGTVTTGWNVFMNNLLRSPNAVGATSNTILSTDATAGSWLRTQKTVGGTDDHPETFFANNPRNGYSTRVAATAVPALDGTTVNVNEITTLGMRGMGLTPLLVPNAKLFIITVNQP